MKFLCNIFPGEDLSIVLLITIKFLFKPNVLNIMNLLSTFAMTAAKAEAEGAFCVLNVQNLTTMDDTNFLF